MYRFRQGRIISEATFHGQTAFLGASIAVGVGHIILHGLTLIQSTFKMLPNKEHRGEIEISR